MPKIAAGASAAFAVPVGSTVSVTGGLLRFEFPTGTILFEGDASGQAFGPFTGSANATITSLIGGVDYAVDTPLGVVDSSSGLAPYTGLIATRGAVHNNKHTTNKQANARSSHFARETITSLRLVLGAYAVLTSGSTPTAGSGETGSGASQTVEAAIEYPSGTMTRVTFSGSNTGTIADAGTLISDAVSVSIPRGAQFWVRQYITGAGFVVYTSRNGLASLSASLGEGSEFAASGLANKVMSGSIPGASGTNVYPLAIIGTTSRPTVFFWGDSRAAGTGDTMDSTGNISYCTKLLGRSYAYAGSMIPGDLASASVASNSQRLLLIPYASHIAVQLGINDVGAAVASATILASLQSLWTAIAAVKQPQAKLYQATLEPYTTSSDSWATLANQTVTANEANRVALNTSLRASPQTNLESFIDVADVLEAGRNSGKWNVTSLANGWTADGLHASAYANQSAALTVLASMGL